MECSEGIEGVREDCCFHELLENDKHFPAMVCCWCGHIYAVWDCCKMHGEYKPDFFKKPKVKKVKRSTKRK